MRILRGYLFRSIVAMTGLVLAVLLGLGFFIEFVGQLNDISGDYGIPQALMFAILRLPNLAHVMLPMAVLLGALLGLGGLANHSELTAIRAAGVSISRLAGAVMITGFVLTLITLTLGHYVGPPLDLYARQIRTEAKHSQTGIATGRNIWIRDGNTILNISRLGGMHGFGGVTIFSMMPGGGLEKIARADSADVDDEDRWVLRNYAESRFVNGGVAIYESPLFVLDNNLSADIVGLAVVRPSSLSGVELWRYIEYLQSNGLNAHRYVTVFWNRVASSIAVMPMCMLALPLVVGRMRSAGSGARMVVGLVIGLGYFLASRSLADGGEVFELDAALIAWLPTIALIAITSVALARTR